MCVFFCLFVVGGVLLLLFFVVVVFGGLINVWTAQVDSISVYAGLVE